MDKQRRYGANVAMLVRLLSKGHEVGLLGLLDTQMTDRIGSTATVYTIEFVQTVFPKSEIPYLVKPQDSRSAQRNESSEKT